MWSADINNFLNVICQNANMLYKEHRKQYFRLKDSLRYFRVPTIIISAISSIVSVGLTPYLEQKYISMTTCILGLSVSVIGSIEMYLHIQQSMETHLESSKAFQLLGIEITKTLSLKDENRPDNAREYFDKQYLTYIKLLENSEPLIKSKALPIIPLTEQNTALLPNIPLIHIPSFPSVNASTPTNSDGENI